MSHWETLVANALVGTDRSPAFPPPGDTPLDGALAQLQDLTPPRRLLASAAIVALWKRAGSDPAPVVKPLPDPAPRENAPFCSPRASRDLLKMLGESIHDLVPEYLAALARHHKVISPLAMPELFDYAIHRPPLRQLIMPVLGLRGRWLASQNPEWATLFVTPDVGAIASQWEVASRSERLTLLPQLRAWDAGAAREAIAKTWDEDPADDRAVFLAALAGGLSPADEAFLEAALDDRSKRVRAVAADLLARLPGSALGQRMIARLWPLVKDERSRLDVALPSHCDAAMERDGIEPKPPAGIGERAWWLAQIIAAAPLSFWTERNSCAPTDLLKRVAKSDQRAASLSGWARAAGRCGDGAWCDVLLRQWIEAPWTSPKSSAGLVEFSQPEELVGPIPQDRLEAWLMDLAKKKQSPENERNSTVFILSHYRRPWGAALTRAVLHRLWDLTGQSYDPLLGTWATCPVELWGDPSVETEFSKREIPKG